MQTELHKLFFEDTGSQRCGCYIINPHLIGIKYKHALVPLRHIDYQLQIINGLLNVNLTQKYYNPTEKFLEVAYSLPMVPDSSIYKFTAEFDNVKIEGVVKEKEQAKKQFQKAKSEGKQVVLGNIDPDSKDILNFQIGNIPPQTQFTVRISMLQEIKVSMSSFYRLEVPCTISPRYMNKIEGISKISEHQKIKSDKQSSGPSDFQWGFKIDLRTSRKLVFFDSPSHSVDLLSQNQEGTQTILVMKNSERPNKDFIFLYTTEDFYLPSYVLGTTDTSTTVMLSFIPKFCNMELGDAYKASIQNKSFDVDIENVKGDYVFFLDRSGSMGGSRIQKAKQALVLFLKSLPEDSYFNVISFGNSSERVYHASQKNNSKKIELVVKQVEGMTANMGGTQIYSPLKAVLQQKVIEGYPRHIFLLTDGQVNNTQGVIDLVKKKTKYSRVHTIGIGDGASYDLIQGCAKGGKGKYIMIPDNQNPAEKIISLLQESLTPLISKVSLNYQQQKEIESVIPNPKSIPYILKDESVNFYITFAGPLTEKKAFTFEYEDPITKMPYKSDIQIVPNFTNNQPFIDKMAHFKILRELQNCAKDGMSIQDSMYYVKIKDFKQQAINYSIKHQVLSQYTSFICVGKQLVDGKFQQYQNKGTHKVFIEQPQPKSSSYSNYYAPGASGSARPYSGTGSPYGTGSGNPYGAIGSASYGTGSGNPYGATGYTSGMSGSAPYGAGSGYSGSSSYGAGGSTTSYASSSSTSYQNQRFNIPPPPPPPPSISNMFSIPPPPGNFYGLPPPPPPKLNNISSPQSNLFSSPQFQPASTSSFNSPPVPPLAPQAPQAPPRIAAQLLQNSKQYSLFGGMSIKATKQQQVLPKKAEQTQNITIIQSYDVGSIVKMQQSEGCWKNLKLIQALSKNSKEVNELSNNIGAEIVITKLVVLWLNKNHPQKQYSLIIKKAVAWLKKALKEKGIDESKLEIIQVL